MFKSTLSLIAVTAIVFGAETDSESEGSWSPRSVDMSLTGSPYSADASRGSARMSLCSSLDGTPTHQPQSARTTPSPSKEQLAAMTEKIKANSGRSGSITAAEFAAMLNNPQQ